MSSWYMDMDDKDGNEHPIGHRDGLIQGKYPLDHKEASMPATIRSKCQESQSMSCGIP